MQPLEVLFESPRPGFDLPGELAALYGGTLGFDKPCVYANFVESMDGVTAIPALPQSNRLIAAGSEQDRFVMGLLRACADAVLIGAGTLEASPQTQWTAEDAYPPAAALYAQLRERRSMSPQPLLAVLSGSGNIDPAHPGFTQAAIVLTSRQGAEKLNGSMPSSVEVVAIGESRRLDVAAALQVLRERGHRIILCEGGPTLLGALVESNLLDELFLTISPRLAGRGAQQQRLSLIEHAELLPDRVIDGRLISVRRAGSHVFLRFAMTAERNNPT